MKKIVAFIFGIAYNIARIVVARLDPRQPIAAGGYKSVRADMRYAVKTLHDENDTIPTFTDRFRIILGLSNRHNACLDLHAFSVFCLLKLKSREVVDLAPLYSTNYLVN